MDELLKKMAKRKHIVISICCILLVFVIAVFMAFYKNNKAMFAHDYPQIVKNGTLKVIVEPNKMSYRVIDMDSIVGLQVKMIERFAEDHNLKVEFVEENDLSKAMEMLDANEIDVLVWHIPVYDQLKNKISYTIPVFTSRQMLIQRKKSKTDTTQFIRNQLDLAGKTLYILPGTIYKQRIEHLSKEIGDTIHIKEIPNADPSDLFKMIIEKNIDYTVCDEFVARVLLKDFPTIDMGTAVSFTQNYSWGINPASTILKDSLDSWLAIYLESKDYNRIYRQYTGVP